MKINDSKLTQSSTQALKISLEHTGFTQLLFSLPNECLATIQDKDWQGLDQVMGKLLLPGAPLYLLLSQFITIRNLEYIISIRSAPHDEDGIWHDDGSRELAFTISLTPDHDLLEGGVLHLRHKENQNICHQIKTPSFGTITLMQTGKGGFEHCLFKVKGGRRVVCAGWLNHD